MHCYSPHGFSTFSSTGWMRRWGYGWHLSHQVEAYKDSSESLLTSECLYGYTGAFAHIQSLHQAVGFLKRFPFSGKRKDWKKFSLFFQCFLKVKADDLQVIQEVRQKEHCKFIYECPCVSALGCFSILSPCFRLHGKEGLHTARNQKSFRCFLKRFLDAKRDDYQSCGGVI